MIPPIIIKIYGGTGSGKTPWLHWFLDSAQQAGKTVWWSDMELFTFDPKFEKKLAAMRVEIQDDKPDFAVLCIGIEWDATGFRIEIEQDISAFAPIHVLNLLRHQKVDLR